MDHNIKFIAQRAGVSPATVSRVLNGTKRVSAEVTERVLREVQKYNYRPNFHARGLITRKSNLIAVIAPNVSDAFHAQIISAITRRAAERDYNVIVANIYGDFQRQLRSCALLAERSIDGLVILHENTEEEVAALVREVDVPMVLASVNVPGSLLPSVGIDDEQAACDAVNYLLRIGHRKIAGVFCAGQTMGVLRKAGYLRALREAGIKKADELIVESETSMGFGEEAIRALLRLEARPTAVFCAADELAVDMINLLTDHGYRVPGDISVFGFDDVNATQLRPRLSTIAQPIEAIGGAACDLLLDRIEGKCVPLVKQILPHRLTVRDSCRAMD